MSTITFKEKIIVHPNFLAAIRAALVMVIVDENFELKKNPEKMSIFANNTFIRGGN